MSMKTCRYILGEWSKILWILFRVLFKKKKNQGYHSGKCNYGADSTTNLKSLVQPNTLEKLATEKFKRILNIWNSPINISTPGKGRKLKIIRLKPCTSFLLLQHPLRAVPIKWN